MYDKRRLLRIKLYLDVLLLLKSPWRVRGAVRIARQPSKLKVMGSNPIGPAISLFKRNIKKAFFTLYRE
jgi:hypothetical protein